MECFKDFTYYLRNHLENVINIGWINKRQNYMNGDVSKVFLNDYFNTVQLVMDTDITQNFKR